MFTVNKSQVALINGHLVGEASTLGLGPGEWPQSIAVVDDAGTGFLFHRGSQIRHGGDCGGFNYFARGGQQLVVFND